MTDNDNMVNDVVATARHKAEEEAGAIQREAVMAKECSSVYVTSVVGAICQQADSDAEALVAYHDEVKRTEPRKNHEELPTNSELFSLAQKRLKAEGVTSATRKGPWKALEPEMRALQTAARQMAAHLPEGSCPSSWDSSFSIYFSTWLLHFAIQACRYLRVDMVLRRGEKLTDEQLDQIAALLWRCHCARRSTTVSGSAAETTPSGA